MIFIVALLLGVGQVNAAFVPDFIIKADDYTALLVVDSKHSEELKPFQTGGHGKFYVTGWNRENQSAIWNVTVAGSGVYVVNVLLKHDKTQRPIRIEVDADGRKTSTLLPDRPGGWQRVPLPPLELPEGPVSLTLKLSPTGPFEDFDASVLGIELVRPEVRDSLHGRSLALRSNTDWFRKAKYGILVHWTWQTQPRYGKAKPYDQAVAEFNIPAFVEQIRKSGAGFVVLTTAHAFQSIPASIASLDALLPGRTSRRDLIAELADALNREGIRLMLYYHPGAINDPRWLEACGFWNTNTTSFFNNWESIIREMGLRYGKRLAGWWFDDGTAGYYYRSAPWEKLAKAAKAGNQERLIGFNPWLMPSPTEFQDFYCGEGNWNPGGHEGQLKPGGDGHYPSGIFAGLQGSACLTFDGDWVHAGANHEIRKPKLTPERLADFLGKCMTRGNVPIFNLEIYQDGTVSPGSVEIFEEARKRL